MPNFKKYHVAIFAITLAIAVPILYSGVCRHCCGQINIYSSCPPDALHKTATDFAKKTGVKIAIVYDSETNLITKINQEGHKFDFDLLVTASNVAMLLAESRGILKKLEPMLVKQNFANASGCWLPISQDAWLIAFNKRHVDPNSTQNYEDLSSNIWHQQIIFFKPIYQHSYDLLLTMMEHNGQDYTRVWFNGLASNLLNSKYQDEQEQINALVNGHARLMIINSSALLGLLRQDKNLAENIGVIFPNQSTYGAHTNVSAAGLLKHAKNKRKAKIFLRHLATQNAQYNYAAQNNEYPVLRDIETPEALKEWGIFRASKIPNKKLSHLAEKAIDISQPHLAKKPAVEVINAKSL